MKRKVSSLWYKLFSYVNGEHTKYEYVKHFKEQSILTEIELKQFNLWMKKVGVSKLYTTFVSIEDPNIILDVPSIATQLKIERIKECHRQYEKSKESNMG